MPAPIPFPVPLRQRVLTILDEIGEPLQFVHLSHYLYARHGENVQFEALKRLRKAEMHTWEQAQADRTALPPVWLCNVLDYPFTFRFGHVIFARSDWPLARRILSQAGRNQWWYRVAARLCDLAAQADTIAAHPEKLRQLALVLATGIPDINPQQPPPFEELRCRAEAYLEQLQVEEQRAFSAQGDPEMTRVVAEAAQLPPRTQLFSEPPTSQRRASALRLVR